MNNLFNEPLYYNRQYWQNGNNFFFYSLYYGFKKNILSYEKSNSYIKQNKLPLLFTADYYESLDRMDEKEINKLLKKFPIEINNNGFGSGRHRVAAMIGRIIYRQSYIPLRVYYLKN